MAIGANWKEIWAPVWGLVWSQTAPEPEAETPPEIGGGWALFFAHERELEQRRKRRRELDEAQEETKRLPDPVDREIAELLRKQEREDERRKELERLRALVAEHGARSGVGRLDAAVQRVLDRQTVSSLMNLERELRRIAEEEELTILMLLLED